MINLQLPALRLSCISLLIILLLNGCGGEKKNESAQGFYMPEEFDRRTELRYRQYAVQGRLLYKQHCANCHQNDGSGLENLIPPLAGSDYLHQDLQEVVCVIRHGLEGPVVVNGTEFNQPMPPNPQLKDIEIAEIATYITNAWGNQGEFITVQKAQEWLNNCPQAQAN